MPLSPGTRPRRESGEPRIERDLSGQILELDVPEPYWQPRIMPSLVQFRNRSEMVSAATLVQKAKQFDDGLYAAVELAALHGCGDRAAKTAWLARLRRALGTDQAATSLYAAARMLDADADVPGPLAESVAKRGRDFLEDERASKPISFYTWTEELAALFRHDRLLQGELRTRELEPLVRALHAEPAVRDQYERYLGLIEQLTNPLTEDAVRRSLRALDEGTEPSLDRASFIPASMGHESELIKRMYGDTPIPEGFELMTELIDRVRSGSIDLSPTADSGWYDHQTWSLAPLARPEDTPEAERLRFTNAYRKHLEDLF